MLEKASLSNSENSLHIHTLWLRSLQTCNVIYKLFENNQDFFEKAMDTEDHKVFEHSMCKEPFSPKENLQSDWMCRERGL